uniref:Uncharacterized protein n=1 Tax=Timema shepardi TaxID=629360 RepID=A0A7R9AVD6_TIMSH|nr:unnamed protein product [Timema shepardi]
MASLVLTDSSQLTPDSHHLAVELNTTSALANYATEAAELTAGPPPFPQMRHNVAELSSVHDLEDTGDMSTTARVAPSDILTIHQVEGNTGDNRCRPHRNKAIAIDQDDDEEDDLRDLAHARCLQYKYVLPCLQYKYVLPCQKYKYVLQCLQHKYVLQSLQHKYVLQCLQHKYVLQSLQHNVTEEEAELHDCMDVCEQVSVD